MPYLKRSVTRPGRGIVARRTNRRLLVVVVVLLVVVLSAMAITEGTSEGKFRHASGVADDIQSSSEVAGSGQLYSVPFYEVGLPFGTTWTVTIHSNVTGVSISNTSSEDVIGFFLPNATVGTYEYSVSSVPGYVLTPAESGQGYFGVYGGFGAFTLNYEPASASATALLEMEIALGLSLSATGALIAVSVVSGLGRTK